MKFCIVGSGRCGSTMLQKMMTLHPHLYVINESHYIPKLYELFGLLEQDPKDMLEVVRRTSHITGQNTLVIPSSIEDYFKKCEKMTIRQFCDHLGIALAQLENKAIWADKTPDYGMFMGLIQSLWPECKFIHIMRNGIDVAASMSHHPGYQWLVSANELAWPNVSYNNYYKSVQIENQPISNYFDFWVSRTTRIKDEAKRLNSNTYLEITYEELCSKTSLVLESLVNFLQINNDIDWTEHCASLIDLDKLELHAKNRNYSLLTEKQFGQLQNLGFS